MRRLPLRAGRKPAEQADHEQDSALRDQWQGAGSFLPHSTCAEVQRLGLHGYAKCLADGRKEVFAVRAGDAAERHGAETSAVGESFSIE